MDRALRLLHSLGEGLLEDFVRLRPRDRFAFTAVALRNDERWRGVYIIFLLRFKLEFLNALEKEKQIHILIGPEGDFSPEEIQQVLNNQWRPVSLGENRLRTETAAIVACTSVANKFVSGF